MKFTSSAWKPREGLRPPGSPGETLTGTSTLLTLPPEMTESTWKDTDSQCTIWSERIRGATSVSGTVKTRLLEISLFMVNATIEKLSDQILCSLMNMIKHIFRGIHSIGCI